MSFVLGLAGLVVLFAYASLSHQSGAFAGVVHLPAIALIVGGPWCAVLIAYSPEQLRDAGRTLLRAMRFDAQRSRQVLFEELSRFAVEFRQRRPAAALAIAEDAEHELVRQLAPLMVKQYDAAALEQTAATATLCLSSALRRSEAVLASLAKAAPAMGLVGTVLGLVKLLRDLNDVSRLGPSMALAMLCTLYGLILANAVYQPLARRVHAWNAVVVEEARLLTRALLLVREGRALADLRALFDTAALTEEAPATTPEVAP